MEGQRKSQIIFNVLSQDILELTSEKIITMLHYVCGQQPLSLLIRTRTKYIVNWQSPLDNTFLIAEERSLASESTITGRNEVGPR